MDKVHVHVERGAGMKVPVSVNDYEVPILETLHDTVHVIGSEPIAAKKAAEIESDPAKVWETLDAKYSAPDAQKAFRTVYPHVGVLADRFGSKAKKRTTEAAA